VMLNLPQHCPSFEDARSCMKLKSRIILILPAIFTTWFPNFIINTIFALDQPIECIYYFLTTNSGYLAEQDLAVDFWTKCGLVLRKREETGN